MAATYRQLGVGLADEDERRLAQTLLLWLEANRHAWHHPRPVFFDSDFTLALDRSAPDRISACIRCQLCQPMATVRVQGVRGAKSWNWVTSNFNKHMKARHPNDSYC